jgi:hypothetical protein
VEWPVEYHSPAFSEASEAIARSSEVDNDAQYEERVGKLVERMIDALARARESERPLQQTLLLVVCADGGGIWNEVQKDAVRRLNGPIAYQRWLDKHV